ncbi:MAG: hypothetical protein J6R30_04535 [Bacteroidales bacterium]|jgi:hypothetical protein|nr:hypothetical protein [Bacteroidales bacterium]
MLGKIAGKLGPELFELCKVAGEAMADFLDKAVDKVFDHLEGKKGGES